MPAKLLRSKRGASKTVNNLEELARYELRPETNQEWLSKGVRPEKLVLYRDEFKGPKAQLTVFRDHPRMGGAPFSVNRPKPTRVGQVTLHRRM